MPKNGNTFDMKKKLIALFSAIIALAALCLSACDVEKMTTLPQLSKPYLGLYECEELTLGGEDLLGEFESLNLELKYGGEFELSSEKKDGGKWSYGGKYQADPETGEITFSAFTGLRVSSFTFPMKEGSIIVEYNFGGKLFRATFSTP